jgi:hypothetical protein
MSLTTFEIVTDHAAVVTLLGRWQAHLHRHPGLIEAAEAVARALEASTRKGSPKGRRWTRDEARTIGHALHALGLSLLAHDLQGDDARELWELALKTAQTAAQIFGDLVD